MNLILEDGTEALSTKLVVVLWALSHGPVLLALHTGDRRHLVGNNVLIVLIEMTDWYRFR